MQLKDAANFTAADSEDDCVRQAQFTKTLSTLMGIVTPKPGAPKEPHTHTHRKIRSETIGFAHDAIFANFPQPPQRMMQEH